MQVGDPKKALILAIVAIIIVCVAAFQLMPKGLKTTATQVAAAGLDAISTPSVTTSKEPLPTTIISDPFSRPSAAKPDTGAAKDVITGAPKDATAHKSDVYKGGPFAPPPSAVPEDPMELSPIPFVPHDLVDDKGKPVEFTGIDQEDKKGPKKTSITLTAIVRVDHRIALVSVNGKEPARYEVGSVIGEDIRVIELTDSKMKLQMGTIITILDVGGDAVL